jgi:predicted nucleotide-binding protein
MDSFLDAFIIAVDYTEKLENKEANRIIEMESVKSENEEIINKLQKKMQQFEGRFFETILQIPDDIFVPMILSINEMLFLLG